MGRKPGPGIRGPYPHGNRFRLLIRKSDGKEAAETFGTREEAVRVKRAYLQEWEHGERTIETVIDEYLAFLRDVRRGKEKSYTETIRRMRLFFEPVKELPLTMLSPSKAKGLYLGLQKKKKTKPAPGGKRVETDKPLSVDTCRNVLLEAKSFLLWCKGERWISGNPLDGVKGEGKRRKGKAQLRIDEARAWSEKAIALANGGDTGAVGALCAILLSLRASAITSRVVRDLDDGGRLIWIPDDKTEAGKRTLEVPDEWKDKKGVRHGVALRRYLLKLAEGKGPDDLLFGRHWRDWPAENVKRICAIAKVPAVCAHSMRGLHATLAKVAGATGWQVADQLGHASPAMAEQSYIAPGTTEAKLRERGMEVLDGGRKGKGRRR